MNSKLAEEQKKEKVITSVEVLISTQIRIKSKKEVKMIMVAFTRPSPSNALLLGRVLGLDSAHP